MIWQSCNHNTSEKIINLVSENSYSILDIVNAIIKISGKNIRPEILNTAISVQNYVFNNDLMQKLFGKEQVQLLDGLKAEYDYFETIENEHSF
jgi:UDP-glucose 4-epimerase